MLVERIEKMLDEGCSAADIRRTLEAEGEHSRAAITVALKEALSVETDLDELDEVFEEEERRHAHDQRRISAEEQRRGD